MAGKMRYHESRTPLAREHHTMHRMRTDRRSFNLETTPAPSRIVALGCRCIGEWSHRTATSDGVPGCFGWDGEGVILLHFTGVLCSRRSSEGCREGKA